MNDWEFSLMDCEGIYVREHMLCLLPAASRTMIRRLLLYVLAKIFFFLVFVLNFGKERGKGTFLLLNCFLNFDECRHQLC